MNRYRANYALGRGWRIVARRAIDRADPAYAVVRPDALELRHIVHELVRTPEDRARARALLDRVQDQIPRDDLARMLLSALDREQLLILQHQRPPPTVDARPGIATPDLPSTPPAEQPPIEISNKSLLISHCPAEYAPRRGPMQVSYLLRELAGEPVELIIRAPAYAGELVLRQSLGPDETQDGAHDFEWEGTFASGAEEGDRVRPELSPYLVELVHDEVYRDEASFVVVPPTIEVLAFGDHNFSTDREVMLPAPSTEAEAAGDLADGIALVAGLLLHLRELDEPREVLVAGHTDASGSDAHNLALSERRAQSVQLFCAGERDDWASHAHDNATVADGQEVLRWVSRRFGWPCDPGEVDDRDGPQTSAARDAFRARYAHEFDGEAGSGDGFELDDWGAFFNLYEQDLAARLGIARDDLAGEREALSFTDPPMLACGEHWPESGLERSAVCRRDRRVELLCFHPEELPDPIGGDDPPGASIYTPGAYRWTTVEPGPGPHDLEGPCFELALAIDDPALVPDDASLRLQGGPYDLAAPFAEAETEAGLAIFHFHGIAAGTTYSLRYEAGEADPVVLFADQDLDPYIDGIGDEEAGLVPVAVALLPLSELPPEDEVPDAELGPMAEDDLHLPEERDPTLFAAFDALTFAEVTALA